MSHTVCMPRCVLVAVIFGSALWGALVGANLVSGFAQAEPEPEALPAYEQGRGITWAYVNAYQGAVLDGRCPVCDHVNYALDYSGAGQVVPRLRRDDDAWRRGSARTRPKCRSGGVATSPAGTRRGAHPQCGT
jgi:hypothetical protein